MKISIFTGRHNDSARVESVSGAIAVAKKHRADMMILPGNSLGSVSADGKVLQKFADKNGISILAEVNHTFLFRPNQPRLGPFCQRFSTIRDVNHRKVDSLTNEFLNSQRIFRLKKKRIGVLLCGENNILRSVRGKGKPAQRRYESIGWPFDVYDVLVNPAHTSWQRWFLLPARLAYCSQGDRTAIFCTNNTFTSWENSLFVYHNGKEHLRGGFGNRFGWPVYIQNNWRMVTVEV